MRRGRSVAIVEQPPATQRDAEGLKIGGRHHAVVSRSRCVLSPETGRQLLGGLRDVMRRNHQEQTVRQPTVERHRGRGGHLLDAGNRAEPVEQPGIERRQPGACPPGIYFRLLLIGYCEGIDSERGLAWRADSLALRDFLGLVLPEAPPDHSTVSRTRRLIDLETHEAVFTWMLQCLADAGLVNGKTVGVDATTLEANAALRSIVRRDTGESYLDFLTKLAYASGIETPTRADLARMDRSGRTRARTTTGPISTIPTRRSPR
jgi:Transposase domain (DUF772)